MQVLCNERDVGANTELMTFNPPVLVADKYQCYLGLRTPLGTKIYFANIQSLDELPKIQMISVAMSRDQDYYVLAPDTTNPDRPAYLYILCRSELGELAGVRQNVLFDFFHYDKRRGQLIALAREFPELYAVSSRKFGAKVVSPELFTFGFPRKERPIRNSRYQRITGYANRLRIGEITHMDDARFVSDFIMHLAYDKIDGVNMMHPQTRFMADGDNVIYVHPQFTPDTVPQFLKTDPANGASIVISTATEAQHAIQAMFCSVPVVRMQYRKFVLIGYPYEEAVQLRMQIDKLQQRCWALVNSSIRNAVYGAMGEEAH